MLTVIPVPCWKDNYAYLVHGDSERAFVVDACETGPIVAELNKRGLRLEAILTTHHHHDHVGGNLALKASTGAKIFGHVSERASIPGLDVALEDEARFSVCGEAVRALHVPGHTLGALTYVVGSAAFTGDTLFCGGCGRLFEGTAEQMFASLTRLRRELPQETILYTGHEYTEANLAFAAREFPRDESIVSRLSEVRLRRSAGECCAFAALSEEARTNVFLRAEEPGLGVAMGLGPGTEPLAVWSELRRRKNVS